MTTFDKVRETWERCISIYGKDRCIAICHHGSFNYELNLPDSDVDTKLCRM